MKNKGIRNEYLFIDEINNKTLSQLNFSIQEFILYLFPNIKNDDMVLCYKNIDYQKPDICIKVGKKIKYISIKMGHKNSVHCESIEKFTKFLENIGVKNSVIKEILRFQYADGTINGRGKIRMDSTEYKQKNENSIKLINNEINNPKIISKIINRFLIQGTQWHSKKVDVLVYGTPNDFFYISKSEIYKYILKKINIESSTIHFSCLTFQPMSRVLDYNQKMEYMRHWIQIKWYNLEDNIIEIMNQRLTKIN